MQDANWVGGNCHLPFYKTVSNSIHGLDHGLAGGGFEFLSEVLDVRVDTAVEAGGVAVQVVEQLLAGQGLIGAAGEQLQEFEFVGREFDGTAVERHAVFLRVDLQPARADDARRFDPAFVTAQQGAHSRNQRTRRERLGDVIVRANLQPGHLIHFLGEGSEHDDGHIAFAAQSLADFAPIQDGEHQVEDDEVGLFPAGNGQRGLTVGGGDNAESVLLQIIARQADDLRFVIHNEDKFGHGGSIKDEW